MSNTKTEAQRLADALDAVNTNNADSLLVQMIARSAASELCRLDAENQQLKTSLALVQQHHTTAWNRGHRAGLRAGESAIKQATDAVKADAWGNTQLTNALMQAEAERDQLRAQVKQAELERDEAQAKCQEMSAQLVEAGKNEDAWLAVLAKAVAEEREACKRTCMDIHKRNDSAFALECALAIEARSNT